ncbi:MAG: zinc-binding dehydrogenase [Myxococcales bacterium]|nr:zinc-binding dehydrogenase [Myxococcales bacterium]
MKQVWIPKAGPPEILEVREAPDPAPKAGEVRVRVSAAGINFADTSARIGMYPDAPPFPCVVGYEASGVIDAVGEGVDAARVGERVLVLTRFGGYASVLCVPSLQAAPMPEAMSFEEAAALPVVYLTAHHMLVYLGNVKARDTVLIHAAAGGVGLAALQLCKHIGAKTIGTASASKHEYLKKAGLDHAIDYNTQDFEAEVKRITDGRGVDIALDAQGGESVAKSLRSLAPTGRVFAFGAASLQPEGKKNVFSAIGGLLGFPLMPLHPIRLMNDNRGIFGVNVGHLWGEVPLLREQLDALVKLYEAGAIKPVIDSTFGFSKAAEGHRRLLERRNIGKVLLLPD